MEKVIYLNVKWIIVIIHRTKWLAADQTKAPLALTEAHHGMAPSNTPHLTFMLPTLCHLNMGPIFHLTVFMARKRIKKYFMLAVWTACVIGVQVEYSIVTWQNFLFTSCHIMNFKIMIHFSTTIIIIAVWVFKKAMFYTCLFTNLELFSNHALILLNCLMDGEYQLVYFLYIS